MVPKAGHLAQVGFSHQFDPDGLWHLWHMPHPTSRHRESESPDFGLLLNFFPSALLCQADLRKNRNGAMKNGGYWLADCHRAETLLHNSLSPKLRPQMPQLLARTLKRRQISKSQSPRVWFSCLERFRNRILQLRHWRNSTAARLKATGRGEKRFLAERMTGFARRQLERRSSRHFGCSSGGLRPKAAEKGKYVSKKVVLYSQHAGVKMESTLQKSRLR